ncbi:cytochrome P450 4d2-like [Hermetia illucens]|uniref:cytochrome P450 4d2-like n=1 Tax=Hermetia illucens TaxID=343691 RepID=UPI0018CC19E1|nr:cytochrome P450 4d2-like [Hermetia illucens]XP_037914478.1 cytochrome P450 4d2-like [Hermetia illucens]XP_037914479.1 cytochrome P450 4d2-like [Hermetia illucens]XP_037914480.1 cytochrome P450 4d2-like [Hermetia illucens]
MLSTIVLIVIPVLLYWNYISRKRRNELTSNIPGPPAYPFIGNLFVLQLRSVQDTIDFLKGFHLKYGKTVRLWILDQLNFCTVDPKLVEIILTSPKYIQKGSLYDHLKVWLGNGLLLSNGRKWFQRRRIITPTFHFKILEEFSEVMDEQSHILVDKLQKHSWTEAFNIEPYITLCALDVISETALGTKINAQMDPSCEYAQAVHTMSYIVMERMVKPYLKYDLIFSILYPKMKKAEVKASRILHDFTEHIIEDRRKLLLEDIKANHVDTDEAEMTRKRKRTLLDVLLQATIQGQPLSNNDIREEVDTFTFEGHDTTTAGISFTLYCLSRQPEVQEKVFSEIREVIGNDKTKPAKMQELQDLKYLEIVIKESMRLYPPVPMIARKLEEDIQINDKFFPAGSDVTIPMFLLMRDPEIFSDPDHFKPERFFTEKFSEKATAYSYIPFSAGPRNCIGQKFAMLEMKCTVSKILRYFELLPMGEEPKTTANLVTRSTNGINLGIRPRKYYTFGTNS